MKKNRLFVGALLAVLLIPLNISAQTSSTGLSRGIDLYSAGQWREAVVELRRYSLEDGTSAEAAEALYWISLSEIASGEYDAAIIDLDELIKTDSQGKWAQEALYQKGRSLYFLGRYDASIVVLKTYADSVKDAARKSSGLYWIGECLYSLGRLEDAKSIFASIVEKYPQSIKFEASSYRLALIDQKKIESELLKLLKWSHEESLKTVEEYQRRERSYEQAIVAYQKRIAEMLKDTRLADLERNNSELTIRLAETEVKLTDAEAKLSAAQVKIVELTSTATAAAAAVAAAAAAAVSERAQPAVVASTDNSARINRLLNLKASALNLKDALITKLGTMLDSVGTTAPEASK
jgi:TolA-binding protein